ncbi:ethylbenzene dehydrogenase-related protein [Oceanimonas sp. CHS3-5]|uniref:ethylbenzene dehydrogenase-related protein n=1 Tax=Oceanimonas sp. CHS3-5 TaxID=3068186 RepID=UPI0027402040|nr:ethylbenzene dehydrogenase-related protein [Oceanimonas sp. CHS3-5]MDP5290853.1 ethylbenzene dehydrogenase-related protein [Oceanimonas sp. CHS3-5]
MTNRRTPIVTACFVAGMAVAWLSQGEGVVTSDPERNIWIPPALTMPLQVQAAYNDEHIFFRYRWPADRPHVYHDMLRYQDGKWVRYGASRPGPDPEGTYEDRVTMLVDDGRVPEFGRYGGYITVGANMRFFTDQAPKAEVAAHPYIGGKMGSKEVPKHLPATRVDQTDWQSVKSEAELNALRANGYFLDLWHWRAGRSNGVNMSDDQLVAGHRISDGGKGPFSTNWDAERNQPLYMFDRDKAGIDALSWRQVQEEQVDFDGIYYLSEDLAKPFDASHPWQPDDVIPRRLLRSGEGSRADISVNGRGRWQDGWWDVTLQRALDTGHPLEDKAFHPQGRYDLAFAVHRDATGSRWHYVSHPYTLGLGRDADLNAQYFEGPQPRWSKDGWSEITLFYPGQVSWPMLTSQAHAGAPAIAAGEPVQPRHSEQQLAQYGVEMEFNDEIIVQWRLTLIAGLVLMLGLWLGLRRNFTPHNKQGDAQ